MKVQNIMYTPCPVFTRGAGGAKNKHSNANKQFTDGINTAAAWFCFGVGLDFVSRRINFFKSPLKNSFALNGIIASTAGAVTGIRAVKDSTKIPSALSNNKNLHHL